MVSSRRVNGTGLDVNEDDGTNISRSDDAAGDISLLDHGKARAMKRKYTRTGAAWAARAAKCRTKLVTKYSHTSHSFLSQVSGQKFSAADASAKDLDGGVMRDEMSDSAHALAPAADLAVVSSGDEIWERGVQADYVERVLLASRSTSSYVDVDSTIAGFVHDEVLHTQWLESYDLAPAYAETAVDSIVWEH